ncbi:hypothetical protein E2C01_014189 [Portunus trituberculatus]|uniref:Uncharacterized protein n=1 Tax=Portunus trituberculatus TaxID=210409 RepID=A0A5B7DI43_PORTR|nr:hypothetical protein [Portunus trituberculatus]
MFAVASTAAATVSCTVTITTNTIIRPIITILVIILGIPSYTSPILSKRTPLGERVGAGLYADEPRVDPRHKPRLLPCYPGSQPLLLTIGPDTKGVKKCSSRSRARRR